jgi:hypothetical protein
MSEKKNEINQTTTIIETTYEKVLSIINKVKEFIKKSSSSAQNLIEDLDWVIKVITNKSLYTYELQKEKLSKQNAEYKTFINFVTKYNEEVIEMNKRHDIVSSIFNLGRKGEILMKPSKCLKRILPDELKNKEGEKEWGKLERKKNFINVFGNQILNLYNQEMEKRRRSCEIIENSESILGYKDKNLTNQQEESENCNSVIINRTTNQNDINTKSDNILKKSTNSFYDKKNKNARKESLYKKEKEKTANTLVERGKDSKINIKRIKIAINKPLNNSKSKKNSYQNKNQNSNQNNYSLEKLYSGGFTKLIKSEKIALNKKSMKSYINLGNKGFQIPNAQQYVYNNNSIINNYNNRFLYKTDYNININLNNNYNYNINKVTHKKNKNSIEKGFMLYKTYKFGNFPYNMGKTSYKVKSNNKNLKEYNSTNKNLKNLKTNFKLNSNENKHEIFSNDNYKYYLNRNNNYYNNKKFSKKIQINAEDKNSHKDNKNKIMYNNIYSMKTKINQLNNNPINSLNNNENRDIIENNNIDDNNKSENKDIKEENNNSFENENKYDIKSLVDKYFEDIKMITDKDFNIFDFQKKVGYQNVLPIMCFIIMKTLGLIDNKIISVKKLNSFLFTVRNSYKQTT